MYIYKIIRRELFSCDFHCQNLVGLLRVKIRNCRVHSIVVGNLNLNLVHMEPPVMYQVSLP